MKRSAQQQQSGQSTPPSNKKPKKDLQSSPNSEKIVASPQNNQSQNKNKKTTTPTPPKPQPKSKPVTPSPQEKKNENKVNNHSTESTPAKVETKSNKASKNRISSSENDLPIQTTPSDTTPSETTPSNIKPESIPTEMVSSNSDQKEGEDNLQNLNVVIGKLPRTFQEKQSNSRLIVVLESAFLETAKVGKDHHLLNCDDHQNIFRKAGRNFADARPDITHQCLLNLLDSPLNQAGLLQVYIHTQSNQLIEVHPQIRIPRTYKRFAGLFVQLLHKLSIRSTNGPDKLLKLVKTPVSQYFPQGIPLSHRNQNENELSRNDQLIQQYGGCPKIGTSYSCKDLWDLDDFVKKELPASGPVVFVVGAFSHGKVEVDYLHREIAISQYPLSAALVTAKICTAFERKWGIL